MKFDSFSVGTEHNQVGINPHGGYVSSWRMRNHHTGKLEDVLYVGTELKRSGIPVLFPYFGKSEGLPQHGFGRNCEWGIVAQDSTQCVLELHSRSLSDDVKLWYPYSFVARITILAADSSSLVYSLTVENLGDVSMPIVPGIHPYWAIRHEDKSLIVIDGVHGFDSASYDWLQSPPDTRFDFDTHALVKFPDKTIEITDSSGVVKHLVVWSLTPLRDPDYDFVCVEPVCGYNNEFETAPILIAPHSSWDMRLTFTVSIN